MSRPSCDLPRETLTVYDRDERIGRVRYRWISPGTIHVLSLVTRTPQAIWRLKQQLDALPWTQLMFHRRKLKHQGHPRPWRFHCRRLAHV